MKHTVTITTHALSEILGYLQILRLDAEWKAEPKLTYLVEMLQTKKHA